MLISDANNPHKTIPFSPTGKYVFTRYGKARSGSLKESPNIPNNAIPGITITIAIKYFNKNSTDSEKINSGRRAIIFSFFTALLMSMILLYLKFDSPESAFTHTLNSLRYYINCGIVVLIISAIFLIKPKVKVILIAFIMTIPINFLIQFLFTEINYFLRAFIVIIFGLIIVFFYNRKKILSFNFILN